MPLLEVFAKGHQPLECSGRIVSCQGPGIRNPQAHFVEPVGGQFLGLGRLRRLRRLRRRSLRFRIPTRRFPLACAIDRIDDDDLVRCTAVLCQNPNHTDENHGEDDDSADPLP